MKRNVAGWGCAIPRIILKTFVKPWLINGRAERRLSLTLDTMW